MGRGAAVAAVATAVAGLGTVAGCAAQAGASASIELATAYVPVPPTPGTTVAYVVIRNNGSADRLVAAHTSVGGRVTFRTAHGRGASAMSTIASVRIPAHATLAMRPDGVHMVITGAGRMRRRQGHHADAGVRTRRAAVGGGAGHQPAKRRQQLLPQLKEWPGGP